MHASQHPLSRTQAQGAGQNALALVTAMFTGDLTTFNRYAKWPKARQQDMDAEPMRKGTVTSGPTLAGTPTQDATGNIVLHLTATAKSSAGKAVQWTFDVAVSPIRTEDRRHRRASSRDRGREWTVRHWSADLNTGK